MPAADLDKLLAGVKAATGSDRQLDRAIHEALYGPVDEDAVPGYTASVDACLDLIHRSMPGWGWHVGFGPLGIIPYASLHKDEWRSEARAPTVPLALLAATLAAAKESGLPGPVAETSER